MSDRPATILIIDDDTSVRKVAQFRLARGGYHVLTAADGEEGLQLAKTERPHAIPVIPLTVVEAHDDLHEPIGPGWVDRISKPYDPEHLLQKVQAVLTIPPPTPERTTGT